MEKQINILKLLKQKLIDNFGNDIQNVILFGSQAYGNSKEDSDYDVLIVLKNAYDWKYRDRIYDISYDISVENDIIFDIHLLSADEISNSIRAKQPIFQNALKQGVYA